MHHRATTHNNDFILYLSRSSLCFSTLSSCSPWFSTLRCLEIFVVSMMLPWLFYCLYTSFTIEWPCLFTLEAHGARKESLLTINPVILATILDSCLQEPNSPITPHSNSALSMIFYLDHVHHTRIASRIHLDNLLPTWPLIDHQSLCIRK